MSLLVVLEKEFAEMFNVLAIILWWMLEFRNLSQNAVKVVEEDAFKYIPVIEEM